MKQLNQVTTGLLMKFIDKLAGNDELDILLVDHPTLRISRVCKVTTEEEEGFIVSIGVLHDKTRVAYKHMMEFIVIDRRGEPDVDAKLIAYPAGFRDDVNDVAEASCQIKDNRVDHFSLPFQRAHASLAYNWFLELRIAGYFD